MTTDSGERGSRRSVGDDCPECHGTRTLDGITDDASAAAWLDCTTCSAIAKEPPVHLLDREPYGERVAVCGVVEHARMAERLNFTIDPDHATCPICERRGGLVTSKRHLWIVEGECQ